VLCLLDQANAEARGGLLDTALTTASRAADLIQRTPYALRTAGLRDTLGRQASNAAALRTLDKRLADLAA
jgi:hypothetical protein